MNENLFDKRVTITLQFAGNKCRPKLNHNIFMIMYFRCLLNKKQNFIIPILVWLILEIYNTILSKSTQTSECHHIIYLIMFFNW